MKEYLPSLTGRSFMSSRTDDTFPPHLKTIPWGDKTPTFQIFDFSRLYDTIILMFHAYYLDINGVHNLGPAGAETMRALELRNATLHIEASTGLLHPQNMFTSPNVGLRSDWYSDAVFAQQSFTGPNPTTIALASKQWLQIFTQAAAGNTAVLNLLNTAPAGSFYIQDYSYFREAVGLKPTDQIVSSPSDDNVPQFGCAFGCTVLSSAVGSDSSAGDHPRLERYPCSFCHHFQQAHPPDRLNLRRGGRLAVALCEDVCAGLGLGPATS